MSDSTSHQPQKKPQKNRHQLDRQAVATARVIPLEVVEAKGHGHAGTAMGLAPLAHVLFQEILRHDPAVPDWPGRDRLILSAGHASLMLYTQLFLTGYGLELDEITKARSFGSRTPGHPERGHTPGVEMSTGPLGQGVASAVGLAGALLHKRTLLSQAAKNSAAVEELWDQTVWVIAGDGCLQEGVSSEAASLAGTLNLTNLVVIWDDNGITIDGSDQLSFREDTATRFTSYGWDVLAVSDPEDLEEIASVLEQARRSPRPALVVYPSIIGYPAPRRQGTSAAHAGAFGPEETAATKTALGFPVDTPLTELVSAEVVDYSRKAQTRGRKMRARWESEWRLLLDSDPGVSRIFRQLTDGDSNTRLSLEVLENWPEDMFEKDMATRTSNGQVIAALNDVLPLWGGAADLSDSTGVALPGMPFSASNYGGDFWAFGVREHAMAAILTGIALEGTWRPYGATYLAFSDYAKPALRLASLMELPTIYVFTHDSVAVGEDGPTHQPVEHIAALRGIPGISVIRPADTREVIDCWSRLVRDPQGPAALILSRQPLSPLGANDGSATHGGYVAWQHGSGTDIALLATGSEVSLAVNAAKRLSREGVEARAISLPCLEWFDKESRDYRDSVLPETITARVAIEAGRSDSWWKYVGRDGQVVSIDQFGTSGPGNQVLEHYGITTQHLLDVAHSCLSHTRN